MREFRTIATQFTRRGGNICYSCFRQLVPGRSSSSKIPGRYGLHNQTLPESLEQELNWVLEATPKPPPRSLIADETRPKKTSISKSRPKVRRLVNIKRDSQYKSPVRPFTHLKKASTPKISEGEKLLASEQRVVLPPSATDLPQDAKVPRYPQTRFHILEKRGSQKVRYHVVLKKNSNVARKKDPNIAKEPQKVRYHIALERGPDIASNEGPKASNEGPNIASRTTSNLSKVNGNGPFTRPTAVPQRAGTALRLFSTTTRVQAAAIIAESTSENTQLPLPNINMTIHDKLRQFQKNLDSANAVDKTALELALADISIGTDINVSEIIDEEDEYDFEEEEELDLDESRTDVKPVLEPGDLIELGSAPDSPLAVVTAIFAIGAARHVQFVTVNSVWEHRLFSLRKQPTFAIRRFFTISELANVKRHLPKAHLSTAGPGQAQNNYGILPAEVSNSVVEKMQAFGSDADKVYQQHATTLDKAFELLSKPDETSIISLEEIVHKVLKIDKSTTIQNEMLYAVHKACALYNFGFLLDRFHWYSRKFELLSKKDIEVVSKVHRWTRQHSEHMVSQLSGQKSSKKSILEMFAEEVQPVILNSRKNRESLAGGHLGSSKLQLDNMQEGTVSYKSISGATISNNSRTVFDFLKLFADRTFNRQGRILLQSLASMIMKSTGLHGNDEVFNNHASKSLLKECGILSPWQAPNYSGGRWSDPYQDDHAPGSKLLIEAQKETELEELKNDVMKELRHDFGDMPVYCIDSDSTVDRDDGISLEKTSEHGTYWIHVHIANPTAFTSQYSKVSKLAQVSRTSIYLPDRVNRMLPLDVVGKKLSLQAGCPTLTISTKISADGVVLDRQIRNGIINNVMHITPEMLPTHNSDSSVSDAPRSDFIVGHFPIPPIQNKQPRSQLPTEAMNELQVLQGLGNAWTACEAKARNRKWSFRGTGRASIRIYHQEIQDVNPNHFRQFLGDPTILFSAPSWEPYTFFPIVQDPRRGLVESIMQLANNSAAEWCAQRGIPALFRGCTLKNRKLNVEAARPFKNSGSVAVDFQEFCRRRSNLRIDTRKEMSIKKIAHQVIGVDAYITTTSPLRRYDDMVNHWQIEAALRTEAKLGRPIVEHDSCRFPFSEHMMKEEITKSIDMSHVNMQRNSHITAHWKTEFLVRGLLFKECKDLPEFFTFYITQAVEERLFGMVAELTEWINISSHQADLNPTSALPEVGQMWKVKSNRDIFQDGFISWQLVERIT